MRRQSPLTLFLTLAIGFSRCICRHTVTAGCPTRRYRARNVLRGRSVLQIFFRGTRRIFGTRFCTSAVKQHCWRRSLRQGCRSVMMCRFSYIGRATVTAQSAGFVMQAQRAVWVAMSGFRKRLIVVSNVSSTMRRSLHRGRCFHVVPLYRCWPPMQCRPRLSVRSLADRMAWWLVKRTTPSPARNF